MAVIMLFTSTRMASSIPSLSLQVGSSEFSHLQTFPLSDSPPIPIADLFQAELVVELSTFHSPIPIASSWQFS